MENKRWGVEERPTLLEEQGVYGDLCRGLTQKVFCEGRRYTSIAMTPAELSQIISVARKGLIETRGQDILTVKVNNGDYEIKLFCILRGNVIVDFYLSVQRGAPDSGQYLPREVRSTGARPIRDTGARVRKTLGWHDIVESHKQSELIRELEAILTIWERRPVVSKESMEFIKSLERRSFPATMDRMQRREYIVLSVTSGGNVEDVLVEGGYKEGKGFVVENVWRLGVD